METKICCMCQAELPTTDFPMAKNTKDRLRNNCRACSNEQQAYRWTARFGRTYKYEEPDFWRIVLYQNTKIVDLLLKTDRRECIGYHIRSKTKYKVIFGDAKYATYSICLIKEDGQVFRVLEFSGGDLEVGKAQVLGLLKIEGLRLELDEASLLAAKALIYYF